jgi:hypothetical protein
MKTRRSRDWQREEEELMKTRFYFALLFLLLLGTGMGRAQSTNAANGVWWDSLSADSKSHFVEGYVAAMRRVNHVLHTDCMDRKNAAKSSADTNAQLSEAINLCALAEFFDFDVDAHKLADGADDFYKDSRNTRLAVDSAMQYARDKLKGKMSDKQLEDEVAEWRREMSPH